MSQKSVAKAPQAIIPSIKISPLQITRLKNEEDEDTWISGEELDTEGSSDEENCRCKDSSTDVSADSILVAPKFLRTKGKTDKKAKATHARLLLAKSKDSLAVQSTSKENFLLKSSVSNEEKESTADDKISWKVNLEKLLLEDEMRALQLHQEEYPKICDSMDKIIDDYLRKLDNEEGLEVGKLSRQNKKLEEVKSSIQVFDSEIQKLLNEIECIKQKTKQAQLQNRLRLKEIIKQCPPESKKLSENTKSFIELYSDNEMADDTDNLPITTLNTQHKTKSTKFCQKTMVEVNP